MNDILLFALICFAAGLAGVLAGATIVWRLATRREACESALAAHAQHTTQEMLMQWQLQQQRALAAFQATQTALLKDFLKSLSTARDKAEGPVSTARPARVQAAPRREAPFVAPVFQSATWSAAPSASSARPPELSSEPLPRPGPVELAEAPARELSDAEIDALPPDLPAVLPQRRRVLPAPKSPVMRRL